MNLLDKTQKKLRFSSGEGDPALKFFLYVGNAYPHKNLDKLLEAFLKLQARDSNTKLVLVGAEDYFYRRLKEKVGEMGLVEAVIFYGPATREELNNLYQKAIALVFPSLMEGFGLPGLEAMANGCPVVCSDIPVFREIYGEAAIYFDPEDVADMTNKINMICTMERESLKLEGLEQVKKYSWEKLARQTLEIYEEV